MNKHLENVEIAVGLVLLGKLSPNAVNIKYLPSPYDQMIVGLREGKEKGTLMSQLGLSIFTGAISAGNVAADTEGVDWLNLLRDSYHREFVATTWEKQAKLLREGQEPDVITMRDTLMGMFTGPTTLVRATEIEASGAVWVKTGWGPWDLHIGGLIEGGLNVLAGPPGTGKTSAVVKLVLKFLKRHKDKTAAIFSLEMTAGQILQRVIDINNPNEKILERLFISGEMLDVSELFTQATNFVMQQPDLGLICIDFIDLIIKGETNVATMSDAYKMVKWLAKETGIPVLLLAQLNEKYTSGEPRVNHLRWSRLAEALSDLIVLIHNPNRMISDQGKSSWLATKYDSAYLIVGKSKWGTQHGGVGAIELGWDGKRGWIDGRGTWHDKELE